MISWVRRRWKRLALVFVALVVIWLASSLYVGWRLTSRAAAIGPEPLPLASLGEVETLHLTTTDGQTLGAWYVPGKSDAPAIVLLHANGGSRASIQHIAEFLNGLGCSVLMPTLRAHGDSTGTVNDFGYSAQHDVIAAVAALETRCPGQPIVVFGQSLGAAAALFAAESLGNRVAGYILECPYENLLTATRNRTRAFLPIGLDYIAYAGLRVTAPLVLPNNGIIDPAAAADRMPANLPVLILAGARDDRATAAEARRIADRLGERAKLVVIAEAGHLGLFACDPVGYRREVGSFLERWATIQ